jgi:processive 1,2-diacylglycerol beta-glucosyltransferase
MRTPHRILILSASAGAGHLRAGEAVQAACRELLPESEALHVDTLTLTPRPFRRLYGKGYLDFVNHAPELVGLVYDRTNRPPKHRTAEILRLAVERLNTRPFVKFVREFAPDVVCHTHFLPAEILTHQRKKNRFAMPQAVVVTDYDIHRFWRSPGIARYFVAREDNQVHLEGLGVAATAIQVTGIPIHPIFSRPQDTAALRAKHAVDDRCPLVLILCGGFGTGPVEALVRNVALEVTGAQIVVIAGRNEALRRRLVRDTQTAGGAVRILGFTSEMHEWLSLAHLVIGKPGGLTTSEALALGVPFVVANAIPGQETRNATMLYETGAGLSGENPWTVGRRVAQLLASPERLFGMRQAALALGRPQAALEIAAQLAELARR